MRSGQRDLSWRTSNHSHTGRNYIDGVSDKLLPNGQPDGREDKVEEKLNPNTCTK